MLLYQLNPTNQIYNRNNTMPRKANKTAQQMNHLKLAILPRCYKLNVGSNPPSRMNSGDVWHDRTVTLTSLADSGGSATITAGGVLTGLSSNSSNIPIRIRSIKCWAIAGTAGTYPPTFIQVNYVNEEFAQSTAASSATIRDSIVDAGGQGAGCPAVGLGVPTSLQVIRGDWTTATTTLLATAVGLPSGGRVMWQVGLCFKF